MKKHVVSLQRVLYIIGNFYNVNMFRKDAHAFAVK